jgi:hypothetical protein
MVRLLLFSLLLAAPALAQQASLSGFVRDAQTGETLLGATVQLEGTTRGAATNTSGLYTLTGVSPGTYTLVASYVGYRPARRSVTLEPDQSLRLDLELAPDTELIDEVVVEEEGGASVDARRVGVAQVSTELIRELPTVLEPDVFRSIQLLPGVKAISDFSSGLYIRGGSPDQTLILLDRTTVYNPTHFFGFFSTFNPDAVKDVRVYKGGYPATYGGRLGSVVDIYNKDGNRNRLDGTATVGLLASRALVEGPIADGRGSFMFAGRRSTLEPLFAALRAADVGGLPDGFYFYDFNGKLNYDLSPDDRLSLGFYTGRDDVDVDFLEGTGNALLDYGNVTGSLNYTRIFSPSLFAEVTATASRYFSDVDFTISATEFGQRTRITDYSVKTDAQWIPNERHELRVGTWTGRFDFAFEQTFETVSGVQNAFTPSIGSWYAQAYVQERWTPSPFVAVEVGLRGQYFEDGGFWRAEPRASLEYKPRGDERLRFQPGYGRYHQFLTLITSEVFSGADFWLTSADGVPPSSGDQFVAGVKTQLTNELALDIEGYYRTMNDLFQIDPYLPDPAGLDYRDFFIFGEGYAAGAEFQLSGRIGRLSGFAAYTLATTRRGGYTDFPNPAPDDGGFFFPKYDSRNDVNLVLGYDLNPSWRLTGVFAYRTGQAYTEPNAQYRLSGGPFASVPFNTLQTQYNASRLEPYHRLDLGATRRGRFFGFADYELQLQVINVYNRQNVWFFLSEFEENNTISRQEVTQIPVPIPNISLTLNF